MNYYVLGILAGAALSVGLFFLIRVLCKKAGDCEYDERQMIGRGKAFRAGFFTTLIAGAIIACLDFCELLPGRKMVRVAFNGTQTTDKPLVASLAIECGALVSIVAADTRVVNGQTLGSMLLALPEGEEAAKALDYIKNYPGITYEEVGSNG